MLVSSFKFGLICFFQNSTNFDFRIFIVHSKRKTCSIKFTYIKFPPKLDLSSIRKGQFLQKKTKNIINMMKLDAK